MKLYPFWDVAKHAHELMLKGAHVYEQFNCANCGVKQTMDTPNQWFTKGVCEECGYVTDIEQDGCSMMVHWEMKK